MEITIRASDLKDLDALLELWKEFMQDPNSLDRPIPTHTENSKRWREFVIGLIDEDPGQIQVAEENGKLVGYVMSQKIVKTPLDMAYNWSYVSDVYVKRNHRRQGIGRKLLQATVEYLKSVGSEHVRLAVWHRNEGAIRLYKELGFKEHMHTLQIEL
jgi:ribosomal protein S18 acetylase RimI-like enzyme